MNLRRLIIHEIDKQEADGGERIRIEYSEDLAENGVQALRFITELNKRYLNLRQSNGRFLAAANVAENFPEYFRAYHAGGTDEEFVAFSRRVMGTLRGYVASSAAKGGYVVFADYSDGQHYVGIFIIRNRQGSILNKARTDTTFVINETMHIDFEHLAMACRINKTLYSTGSGGYLTFINSRNVDSNFFIRWICAEELINNTDDTRKLLTILKSIDLPAGEDGRPMNQADFLNGVYKFIKDSPRGASTDLQEIGRRFYEDDSKLTSFAEEHHMILNHRFKPDSGILRQFVNIRVRAEGIDLLFPQQFLDEHKVEVYPDQGKIVINSRPLMEKIQTESQWITG
jgi:nucleoid-associated protein